MVEEWKWRERPVWSHDGIICTGETYKSVVKLTFAKGAALEDPAGLFNSSLDGNIRRAIDFHEGDKLDEQAFKALVRQPSPSTCRRARASGRVAGSPRNPAGPRRRTPQRTPVRPPTAPSRTSQPTSGPPDPYADPRPRPCASRCSEES